MTSKFVRIRCPDCKHEQITFEKAAQKVKCKKCNKVLVEPSASKAIFEGKIIEELA